MKIPLMIFLWSLISCNSSEFAGGSSKNKKEDLSSEKQDFDGDNEHGEKNPDQDSLDAKNENTASVQEGSIKSPRQGCQAFFSGALLGDRVIPQYMVEIYDNNAVLNQSSEWVGEGKYPLAQTAFPNSTRSTFDGIAFDKGTRVTIYSEPNFSGQVLFDEKGPYVINNFPLTWMDPAHTQAYKAFMGKWKEPLQSKFPVSVRHRTKTNMHPWGLGSLKVTCDRET